jgi:hypothetical protein
MFATVRSVIVFTVNSVARHRAARLDLEGPRKMGCSEKVPPKVPLPHEL